MKRLLVVLLLLVGTVSAVIAAMTADEVIGKYIAAIGGEKNLNEITSVYLSGSYQMKGMTMKMKVYIKPPDKGYMETSVNDMVMGSGGMNGADAWQTQMGQSYILEGEYKKAMTRQLDVFPLFDYQKKGAKATYIDEVSLGDKKAYKLQFITPDTDTMYFYFDAGSYYLVKQEGGKAATVLSDYRKTGPVVMPYKFVTTGDGMDVTTTFDSIGVNVQMPDSLFVMPKNAQPMPKMPGMGGGGK